MMKTSKYKKGDRVMMTEAALESYGKKHKGKVFEIYHVTHDPTENDEVMYDIEGTGYHAGEFSGAVFAHEIEHVEKGPVSCPKCNTGYTYRAEKGLSRDPRATEFRCRNCDHRWSD